MSRLFLIPMVLALTGCFPSGTREAHNFFVLDIPATTVKAATTRARTLVVAPTSVSGFYDTRELVFSREPGTRAYYQYASWTEAPARSIAALLEERLRQSGAFERIDSGARAPAGALLLRTHLDELYHEAEQAPGSVRVAIRAELVDGASGKVLARRSFTQSAAAPSYDAQGAVSASRKATGALLDEVSAWVDATAPR